ncbi:hypothetical protein SAMD00019534_104920, partial [Acytostelium subglobosum LB1]
MTQSQSMDPAAEVQIEVLYIVLVFADITSILGALTVLISFWRLKLLRNHVTRIISYFCITSFIKDSIGLILTLTGASSFNSFSCILYSIVITYGSLSCWLWTLCLAISIYLLIVKRYQEAEKLEKYYFFVCWGIPIAPTVVMLAKDTVEYLGSWCWIGDDYSNYRFGLFYIPFFVIFALSAILVGLTMRYTYQVIHQGVSENKDKHGTYQFKLVNYIIVFLICWIFAVVNRILNSLGHYPYAINLLHTYFSVSHGFYASCVFVYNNPLLWRYIAARVLGMFALCGCCVERFKRLDRNKNNNNQSPYSSSRGANNKNNIDMEDNPNYEEDVIEEAAADPTGADTIPHSGGGHHPSAGGEA